MILDIFILLVLAATSLFAGLYIYYCLKLGGIPYVSVENPQLFLLNMDKSVQRLNKVHKEFADNDLAQPQRFPGVDASQWTDSEGKWDPEKRQQLIDEGVITDNAKMTAGQTGCAVGHLSVWKHVVENKIPWAIVFEDDIEINNPDKRETLFSFFADIPKNADIVFLHKRYKFFPPGFLPFYKNKRVPIHGCGGEGYLISYEGALKGVDILTPFYTTNDVQWAHYFNNFIIADQFGFFTKPKKEKLNAYILDEELVVERDYGVSEQDIIDGIQGKKVRLIPANP